jgi:hypothetical protein
MDYGSDAGPGLGGCPEAHVTCRLEPFTSGLPLTMELARRFQSDVVQTLGSVRPEWPFEDRVLVWLLPNMEEECLAFHTSDGGDIASLFVRHQLESIDEVLERELMRRLDR